MLLAIDIGNTNIVLGVFKAKRLLRNWRIASKNHRSPEQFHLLIKNLFRKGKISLRDIEGIIICSVAPELLAILKRAFVSLFHLPPLVVGEDLQVPMKSLYRNPYQLGQDRLVNAFSGLKIYGSPLVVVDFGTAITFDLVSKRGDHLGGLIAPGIEVSLNGLVSKAALLPKIELARPKALIGRDTANCLLSGLLYGFAGLCDGVVERLKRRQGRELKVIATGGLGRLMARYCSVIDKVDDNLTLKGLQLIFDKHCTASKYH